MTRKLKIPIARLGKWHHPVYGVVKFDQQDFSDIEKNFRKNIRGYEPYLRYGHHEKGPGIHDGERALGFLEDLQQEGEVLWGVFNPTNEDVINEIQNKEYKYASAEIIRNATDKETGEPIRIFLKGQSLTNAPFIPNLPANEVVSNKVEELFSEKGETIFYFSDLSKDEPMVQDNSENTVSKNSEISFMKKFFQKFLALADQMEAMETESKVAEESVAEQVEENEEQQEMDKKDAQIQELTDKLSALEAQVSQLLADKAMDKKKMADKEEKMCEDCEKPMSECKCESYSEAAPQQEAAAPQKEAEVVTEEAVEAVAEEKVEEVAVQAPVQETVAEEDPTVTALKEKLAAMEAELAQARASQEEAARAEAEKAFARMLSDRVTKAVAAGVMPEKANMAANLVKALRTQAQQPEAVMLSEGEAPVDLTEAVFNLLSEGQVDFTQAGAEVQTTSTQELSDNPYRDRIEALRSRNSKK